MNEPSETSRFENPSAEDISALLKRVETIAVVGLSPLPYRPSHWVAKEMRHFGYRIVPVNPNVDEVFGSTAYPTLTAVPIDIDLVDVFRAPRHVAGIVAECIEMELPALWLQDGVIDHAAALRAQAAGMTVVMDRCIFRDCRQLIRR
jgi:predicted CoA-binding protein